MRAHVEFHNELLMLQTYFMTMAYEDTTCAVHVNATMTHRASRK